MKMTDASALQSPRLPKFFSLPLRAMPQSVHSRLLAGALNKILSNDLQAGELDFLQDRVVAIEINDIGLCYRLALCGNKLCGAPPGAEHDLTVRASLYDFMSMASRQVDPDTLVFQRRLVVEGDTELGLALKNYLDGMDVEASRVLTLVESFSRKTMPVYKKLFGGR